jgi:hypothetical protein
MAQRSLRPDQESQLCDRCREHVVLIQSRSANHHPGPRDMKGHTGGRIDHELHQS